MASRVVRPPAAPVQPFLQQPTGVPPMLGMGELRQAGAAAGFSVGGGA